MTAFDAIGIAGTGVTVNRKWMDAVSDNLANINTAVRTSDPAYEAKYVVAAEAADGKGTQVAGIVTGSAEGAQRTEVDDLCGEARPQLKVTCVSWYVTAL